MAFAPYMLCVVVSRRDARGSMDGLYGWMDEWMTLDVARIEAPARR